MPKHTITEHTAQVIAKRLQRRGINYSAAEVRAWPRKTFQHAKLWLDLECGRWAEFMAEYLPAPPRNPGWPAAAYMPKQGRPDIPYQG